MPAEPNQDSGNAVTGGGLSGAILTIVLWILDAFWDIKIPPHVASAMTVVVVTVGAWIGQKLRR
jgi:uncharacterized membrane protein YfcA